MKLRCLPPFASTAKFIAALMLVYTSGAGQAVQAAPQRSQGQSKKRAAPPFNLRAVLETANRYYEMGRLNDALIGYSAILQRYPAHTAAIVQSAKIYYRMDHYNVAAQLFNRIPVTELDPETSYEFGWSNFNLHNYDGALRGFQRVPQGHSLADLANYYGGIAAIKLRRFEVAEDMLEKSLVLPDKLAKSRGMYLKHVQALRLCISSTN
jgi:tetratricopeptide (TPR) repeat protein